MRRKSPISRIISLCLVIIFAIVGFDFGKLFFGDGSKSRLTDVTNILVAGSTWMGTEPILY